MILSLNFTSIGVGTSSLKIEAFAVMQGLNKEKFSLLWFHHMNIILAACKISFHSHLTHSHIAHPQQAVMDLG